MRVVVTGATGNVGTALVRRLAGAGGHRVVGLARRLPASELVAGTEWLSVDLTDPGCGEVLAHAFAGADAVVHLAWAFQPSHDLNYLEALGVGGTRRVLDAVATAEVPHLVHMSSVGAYAPPPPEHRDDPVDEGWSTDGVPTSPYSRHKAAAERLLDAHEAAGHPTVITRMRPGIVGQRSAGSALLRYGLPGLVPAAALSLLPVLPLDRRFRVPVVHADDVATAVEAALLRTAGGPFNLAAEPPLTAGLVADVLDARAVHVPSPALRAVVSASWRARLQQVDPGWLDLAFSVPLLDTSRAEEELDWAPSVDAVEVFRETIAGMQDAAFDRTPVLRPRTVLTQLRDSVTRGPVASRRRP